MRLYNKTSLIISEDSSTDPKMIRFSEAFEDTDVTLLPEVTVRQETFPVATHVISLGNIAQGRFLFIKPKAQIVASIGGQTLTLRANKVFTAWVEFTSLSIIVSGTPAEVVIALAGQ